MIETTASPIRIDSPICNVTSVRLRSSITAILHMYIRFRDVLEILVMSMLILRSFCEQNDTTKN